MNDIIVISFTWFFSSSPFQRHRSKILNTDILNRFITSWQTVIKYSRLLYLSQDFFNGQKILVNFLVTFLKVHSYRLMKYGINLYDGPLGQVRAKSIFVIIGPYGNFFQI